MEFPIVGLGTAANVDQKDLNKNLKAAIKAGYKLIDTAQMYGNEEQIGIALQKIKADRSELWITTKVVDENMHRAAKSVRESLVRLKTDYADMVLIHWPMDSETNVRAYKELMTLREEGIIKHVGVSNFSIEQLEDIHKATGEWPYNNQLPAGPTYFRQDVEEFSKSKGITLTGYSVMKPYFAPNNWQPGSGMTQDQKDYIDSLASKYGKDAGHILNKWAMQHGYHVIPKSSKPARVISNFNLFDFELTNDEVKTIDKMNTLLH